jgi:hypothetical protein
VRIIYLNTFAVFSFGQATIAVFRMLIMFCFPLHSSFSGQAVILLFVVHEINWLRNTTYVHTYVVHRIGLWVRGSYSEYCAEQTTVHATGQCSWSVRDDGGCALLAVLVPEPCLNYIYICPIMAYMYIQMSCWMRLNSQSDNNPKQCTRKTACENVTICETSRVSETDRSTIGF